MAYTSIPAIGPAVHLSQFLAGDLMQTGVYFLYRNDVLVYVGQTKTLKWRLETHLAEGRKIFDSVAFIPCTTDRLLEIESHYIRKHAPKYNNCGIAKQSRLVCSWREPALAKMPPPQRLPNGEIATVDAADVVLNTYEAAEMLRVPQEQLRQWRRLGLLPTMTLDKVFELALTGRGLLSAYQPEGEYEIA